MNFDNLIVTKNKSTSSFVLDKCKVLKICFSGKVGDLWKKEFLISYEVTSPVNNKTYLKKGIISLFTKFEDKDVKLIQTGKFYKFGIILNAKKNSKDKWVNNLDILSVEELTLEENK